MSQGGSRRNPDRHMLAPFDFNRKTTAVTSVNLMSSICKVTAKKPD